MVYRNPIIYQASCTFPRALSSYTEQGWKMEQCCVVTIMSDAGLGNTAWIHVLYYGLQESVAIVHALVWGFGGGGGGDDEWWWFALPLWMVMSMMHDDGDDLHCHCGWWCWWCWWWWRWFADGEDNHHWCRPPKRTLHSFTAGTLLPPTSQLQMTSTPRNILLEILAIFPQIEEECRESLIKWNCLSQGWIFKLKGT